MEVCLRGFQEPHWLQNGQDGASPSMETRREGPVGRSAVECPGWATPWEQLAPCCFARGHSYVTKVPG